MLQHYRTLLSSSSSVVRSTCCNKCYSILSQWWEPPVFFASDHECAIDQPAMRAAFHLPLKTNVRALLGQNHSSKTLRTLHPKLYKRADIIITLPKMEMAWLCVHLNFTSDRSKCNKDCAYPVHLNLAGSVLFFSVLHCLIALQYAFI